VLAGIILALIDLPLAKPSRVSGVTTAGELIDPVHAGSVDAGVSHAVVLVGLAPTSAESVRAVAVEAVVGVPAGASVVARVADAVVQVFVAVDSSETAHAGAVVSVDPIRTDAAVLTRRTHALVDINLAVIPGITWHADTSESAPLVDTCSLVEARVGVALVDVDLAPGPGEAFGAAALEGSRSVDALAVMLARRTCFQTFIDIPVAFGSLESRRAVARVIPTHGISVTPGPRVAGIAGAPILQVTQQSSFTRRTFAVEASHPVMTGSSVETVPLDAVILVSLAVPSHEPVYADTLVSSLRVLTGPVVEARVGQATLVHVLGAVSSRPLTRALARVRVDAVHALPPVLAQVPVAVVNVLLAVLARKPGRAGALVVVLSYGGAVSSILARRGGARDVAGLAVLPGVALVTCAFVSSVCIDAASVLTRTGLALVDIEIAVRTIKPCPALAAISTLDRNTCCSISARYVSAVVLFLAMNAFPSNRASTGVVV